MDINKLKLLTPERRLKKYYFQLTEEVYDKATNSECNCLTITAPNQQRPIHIIAVDCVLGKPAFWVSVTRDRYTEIKQGNLQPAYIDDIVETDEIFSEISVHRLSDFTKEYFLK